MGFFDKFKIRPKDAPTPELVEQFDAAKAGRDEAKAKADHARDRFDESGADADRKALAKALDELGQATLHYERAERLLNAARERDQIAARARKVEEYEQRLAALQPGELAKAEAPLVEREAKAIMELAKVRLERARLKAQKRAEAAKAESIYEMIHGPRPQGMQERDGKVYTASRAPDYSGRLMQPGPVIEQMERLVHRDDPPELLPYIRALTPTIDTYRSERDR